MLYFAQKRYRTFWRGGVLEGETKVYYLPFGVDVKNF